MTVDLVIAGRRIRLSSRGGLPIWPDERFRAFTVEAEAEPDLMINVEPGAVDIPSTAVKMFDAQLMEETPCGIVNTGEPFWEIWQDTDAVIARVFLQEESVRPALVMPHGTNCWYIYCDGDAGRRGDVAVSPDGAGQASEESVDGAGQASADSDVVAGHSRGDVLSASDSAEGNLQQERALFGADPLPYPLDGLLLYFLASRFGDIMIHGSGVSQGGRGWLFSGRSGSGKTTIATIFDRAGDRVIHDDRLLLRREENGWVMHSTPVYRDDEPRSAQLDHLWFIRHGTINVSEPVAGAEAVAMILSNVIQQNWERGAATRLAASADDLAASVRVSRLSFMPDGSVRDYLLLRAGEERDVAAGAVLTLLDEGRQVTVTAGGYSMWPAIRPGDRVVAVSCRSRGKEERRDVENRNDARQVVELSGECGAASGQVAAGEIVFLRRDGGFVMHRVGRKFSSGGRLMVETQGDAVTRADEPAGPEMVAGIVTSVIRRGRQFPPPRRHLPRWFNRAATILISALCNFSNRQ